MELPAEETEPDTGPLEARLGHLFADHSLLELALVHRSSNPPVDNGEEEPWQNERLEFLGDAILGMAISTLLYDRFPLAAEGSLSQWRAELVNTTALGEIAAELGLGTCLRLGRGEDRSGGREKPTILAGAFEAVVGAVFLDGGYEAARTLVARVFARRVGGINPGRVDKDYKSLLQERLQAMSRELPDYQVVAVEGAPHERRFTVACLIQGQPPTQGEGRSKRLAEQAAAAAALEILEDCGEAA